MKDFELNVGDVLEVGDILITVLDIHDGKVDLRVDDELFTIAADSDPFQINSNWN